MATSPDSRTAIAVGAGGLAITDRSTVGSRATGGSWPVAELLMAACCFVWGTAQIAPEGALTDLSVGKIGYGEPVLVVLSTLLLTTRVFRRHVAEFFRWCRVYVGLVLAFCVLGVLSLLVNAFGRDIVGSDLVEMLRPGYYLTIVVVAAFFARHGRLACIALFFPLGIITASVDNFVMVLSGQLDATSNVLQLHNRNVVGNLLAVAILFLAIAFHHGRHLSAFLLTCAGLALVLFSFSKGAWLMGLFSMAAFAVVYRQKKRQGALRGSGVPVLARLILLSALVVALLNIESIGRILQFKVEQSFTADTERADSTVALRWGHILSSLEMAGRHPLLGVGVTNWEEENNGNAYWLNDIFLVNDNPHNGFFYILSGMGLPALLVFIGILMYPVVLLRKSLHLEGIESHVFAGSLLLLLIVSGNFMLQVVSNYFLWLLCGLAIGDYLRLRIDPTCAPHPRT